MMDFPRSHFLVLFLSVRDGDRKPENSFFRQQQASNSTVIELARQMREAMPAALFTKVANYTRDRIFRSIHGNNLVYNACWEDPRIDRKLLDLNQKSKLVMITSAGCNALDYLLDGPGVIHTIDVNPRQNALLELKRATFRHAGFEDLFHLYGNGAHPNAHGLYYNTLRPNLPDYAVEFWDQKIKYFEPDGLKKSFYFYGTSGNFAWFIHKFLNSNAKLKGRVEALLNARSMEDQERQYDKIEPVLWNFMIRWLMRRHTTMALLGVPRAQRELIVNQYPGGILDFLRSSLRHVFTRIPIQDNYFWRVYLTGTYTRSCSPEYLKEENFQTIRERENRIVQHTSTISGFLRAFPDQYTHYILLDHQDWLAWKDPAALEEEWNLILQNSKPGTKILLRSAALKLDFLPSFVHDRVTFHPELTEPLHVQDRVGTYESFHMGTVNG